MTQIKNQSVLICEIRGFIFCQSPISILSYVRSIRPTTSEVLLGV
jgi:hypothetical protein